MIRGSDLDSVAPFADLEPRERDILAAACEEVVVDGPTTIIEEGDEATALYVILEGRAEVSKRGARGAPQVLAQFGPGTLFGEVSLYDPGVRSATVRTRGPARMARLAYAEVERVAEMDPAVGYAFAKGILKILSARLRHASEAIRDQLVWTLGPVVR
jgi:CRP-like cAMP-binding protein